jgi:hypothetical protein
MTDAVLNDQKPKVDVQTVPPVYDPGLPAAETDAKLKAASELKAKDALKARDEAEHKAMVDAEPTEEELRFVAKALDLQNELKRGPESHEYTMARQFIRGYRACMRMGDRPVVVPPPNPPGFVVAPPYAYQPVTPKV